MGQSAQKRQHVLGAAGIAMLSDIRWSRQHLEGSSVAAALGFSRCSNALLSCLLCLFCKRSCRPGSILQSQVARPAVTTLLTCGGRHDTVHVQHAPVWVRGIPLSVMYFVHDLVGRGRCT